uniref:Helicase n=1 Tax=Megaviridae environmental sample TaxID=1737588 RepID=A0A5J6VJY5_9VIRU|nr:MAG: helicase [Megaviridae environmental sample]
MTDIDDIDCLLDDFPKKSSICDYTGALQKLNITELKPKQKEIVDAIMANNNVIGVLQTGFGKSVCFQLPHLLTKKNVIVISPLISLMRDQISKLQELNINAVCFNSTNTQKHQDKRDIIAGKTGILYFSPEYFSASKDFCMELLKQNMVSLVAIDEMHCMSMWGEFRPEYLELKSIKTMIKKTHPTSILAVTATATPEMVNEIKHNLMGDTNTHVVLGDFFKSNLHITINRKNTWARDIVRIRSIILDTSRVPPKTIIYCRTQEDTEKIANELSCDEFRAKAYHAGLPSREREITQDEFTTGRVPVIAATLAFGMGVDVRDIRCVIHYGISKDIESYYQEIGRAGRDNLPSKCICFYSERDFQINRNFIEDINDPKIKEQQIERLRCLEQFAVTDECHMSFIMRYFGDKAQKCNKCDNCISKVSNNVIHPMMIVLRCMSSFKKNVGCTSIVGCVCGANNKKIKLTIKEKDTYGKLQAHTQDQVKNLIRCMRAYDYITERRIEGSYGSVIEITQKGRDLYNNNISYYDDENYTETVYFNIEWQSHTDKHHVKTKSVKTHHVKTKPVKTHQATLDLLQENKSIREIATIRGLTTGTIENHIVTLYKTKQYTNVERFGFDDWKKMEILSKCKTSSNSSKAIHMACGASYFHIKLALVDKN